MTSWVIWLLRAWTALTLVVAVGAAVDIEREEASEPRSAVPESTPTNPRVTSKDLPARDPILTHEPAAPLVAVPVGVDAPTVGMSADLVPVGKTGDGALDVPEFGLAGWYEHSVRPGERGPAVLAGHVDSTTGPDVFFALDDLASGDEIDVRRADGSVATFVVERVETTHKDALPVDRIFEATDEPALRLITCGGAFDRSIRSYESNVIVYATAVDDSSRGLASL